MENAEEGQVWAQGTLHLCCKTPNSSERREPRMREGFLLPPPNQNCTGTLTSTDLGSSLVLFSLCLQPAASYPPPPLIKPPAWLVPCYQPEKENLTPRTLHQTFFFFFLFHQPVCRTNPVCNCPMSCCSSLRSVYKKESYLLDHFILFI